MTATAATMPYTVPAVLPAEPKEIPRVRRTALLRVFLPHLPYLLLKSASHLLYLSPQGHYWDLKTTITVEFLRSFITPAAPAHAISVEKTQSDTTRRTKVAADTWCAEVSFAPSPDFSGESAIRDAIISLGGDAAAIINVGAVPLSGEWVSARSNPVVGEPAHLSPEQNYTGLAADTPHKDSAILYLHGGAYFLCDPHMHRPAVAKLCGTSQTRAFVPRYRLAPQVPFPGALLDALAAYLYLLRPPAGALHEPIAASKIVFSGDSAGGGLSFALLQLLLEFSRLGTRVHWYGQEVEVPLPGGVAGCSSWVDIARCFGGLSGYKQGSEESCAVFDYLPSSLKATELVFRDSPAWNAEVRESRGMSQFYAPDSLITNPLVSPMLSRSWLSGTGEKVPVWMSIGDECLRDQNMYLAHRLLEHGVPLRFEKYTGMPHVFQGLLPHLKIAEHAWKSAGTFIKHATGAASAGEGYWALRRTHPKKLIEEEISREELWIGEFPLEEVVEMVERAVVMFRELAEGKGKGKSREGIQAKI